LSDLTAYAKRRARQDPDFADGLETGYRAFKIGVLLRQARERAGLTQEEVAERLDTKKSAISRIERRAGDIRLSTLERYATAIGWNLSLDLQPGKGHNPTRSLQRARSSRR
jgi:transcriptional regulator with XRE-family HTH domain